MTDYLYKWDGTRIEIGGGGGITGGLAEIDTAEDVGGVGMLNNSHWCDGYIQSGGTASTMHNNGEMFNKDFIRVEPNKTYRFANSNNAWTSDWMSMCWFSDTNLDSYISRPTQSTSASSYTATAPSNANYVILSSRNMTDYHSTATFAEV